MANLNPYDLATARKAAPSQRKAKQPKPTPYQLVMVKKGG